jgi:dTDP-L-rhamnose 4-epimerase
MERNDVVKATTLSIEGSAADNQVFNVGTGVATDVITVAETLIKNYNIEVGLNISGNYRLGDIRHNYADITKIKELLGFTPSVTFEEGINKFTDWVMKQVMVEDKYEQSIKEMKEKGLFN